MQTKYKCYNEQRFKKAHFVFVTVSCMWVAVLEGTVVGVVAAVIQQDESGRAVELQRMSVARSHRHCGVGKALGKKVLEFAASHGYSSVFLGTTAYTPAAHRLYRHLGFRCVGVTNGYVTPGASQSLMEWIFYRVSHHHYRINFQNRKITDISCSTNDQLGRNFQDCSDQKHTSIGFLFK